MLTLPVCLCGFQVDRGAGLLESVLEQAENFYSYAADAVWQCRGAGGYSSFVLNRRDGATPGYVGWH